MRVCRCTKPAISPDPRDEGICLRCLARPSEEWTSGDATVREFFDRLEEGCFPLSVLNTTGPPDWFRAFRLHCEQRELAGRRKFGFSHLARANARECQEELADAALYLLFEILAARREQREEDWALALTAAKHAAEAWRDAENLRTHRREPISSNLEDPSSA